MDFNASDLHFLKRSIIYKFLLFYFVIGAIFHTDRPGELDSSVREDLCGVVRIGLFI